MPNKPTLRERIAKLLCDRDNDSGECATSWEEAKEVSNATIECYLTSADLVLADPEIKEALELLELKPKLVKLADDQTIDIPSEIFHCPDAFRLGFSKMSFANAGWRKVEPISNTFLPPLKSGKFQFH